MRRRGGVEEEEEQREDAVFSETLINSDDSTHCHSA